MRIVRHVQRCHLSSYSSPSLPTCVFFEFQAYLSLPQSTHLAIGLHLIWFVYCTQCAYYAITLLLFGVQSTYVYTYVPALSIHTSVYIYYIILYILYLYCTLHCIKIVSSEFE